MDTMPVLRLTAAQGQALDRATWETYDPEYIVLPFPEFVVRYDEPFVGLSEVEGPATLEVLGHTVKQVDESTIEIVEHMRVSEAAQSINTTATIICNLDAKQAKMIAYCFGTFKNVRRADGSVGEPSWFDLETAEPIDTPRTARAIIGLLLMLNSRECWLAYGVPPTRQQRRAAQRSGHQPEQDITITISPERIQYAITGSSHGNNTHARRAHAVRGHLRHYTSGKVSKVRAYTRGGLPESIPIYDARSIPFGGLGA